MRWAPDTHPGTSFRGKFDPAGQIAVGPEPDNVPTVPVFIRLRIDANGFLKADAATSFTHGASITPVPLAANTQIEISGQAANANFGKTALHPKTNQPDLGEFASVPIPAPQDGQALHDAALAFNRKKNIAIGHVHQNAPVELTKPVIDSDGDPVLDAKGMPTRVLKDKHHPIITHDYRIGFIGVTIPNISTANAVNPDKPIDAAAAHSALQASARAALNHPTLIVDSYANVLTQYHGALAAAGLNPLFKALDGVVD